VKNSVEAILNEIQTCRFTSNHQYIYVSEAYNIGHVGARISDEDFQVAFNHAVTFLLEHPPPSVTTIFNQTDDTVSSMTALSDPLHIDTLRSNDGVDVVTSATLLPTMNPPNKTLLGTNTLSGAGASFSGANATPRSADSIQGKCGHVIITLTLFTLLLPSDCMAISSNTTLPSDGTDVASNTDPVLDLKTCGTT
jgi:hypothetical protein